MDTLSKEYQKKTQQIIDLTFKTLTEAQENYRQRLIQEQEEIEQNLSRQIPEFQLEQQLLAIDSSAVASQLPKGSTLLEFVRFNEYNFQAILTHGDSAWKPARYLAFILPAGQPEQLQMIDLGEAENIDRLIQVFRENIIQGKSDSFGRMITKKIPSQKEIDEIKANPELDEVFQNKQELKKVVLDPILEYLPADNQKIIIAPDGELNLLPFELLPLSTDSYLMDKYSIRHLNVGRDLLRLKFPTTSQPTEPLIIGNPDYNLTDETTGIFLDTATETNSSTETIYADIRESQGIFTPIPGTDLEAEKIAQYLKVTPQTRENALKSLVKSQVSPRILHIATHGYFLSVESLNLLRDTSFSQLNTLNRAGIQNFQNPLLRAGLAFAGVNTVLKGGRVPAAAENGILTGQDIVMLNLIATYLVVVSACGSGLGDIKIGESVHGLRHAFIQAGAKNLIISLWSVNDISTAILMSQFYQYHLENKLPIGKALEKAKRYVRNLTIGEMRDTWLTEEIIEDVGKYSQGIQDHLRMLRDKSDKTPSDQPYKHPKYWGAFIYVGVED